jgi:hypothetical protein
MEAFLQLIDASTDRNFLLAVKYSDIVERAQARLDVLHEKQHPFAPPPTPQKKALAASDESPHEPRPVAMSEPAARDTPERAPDSRADGGHDSYPSNVAMVDTEDRLHVTLAQHAREGKFTVVKLGADWCKPCVRVRCSCALC